MKKLLFCLAAAMAMAGCAVDEPPQPQSAENETIARARAFVEAQTTSAQTRGVNKNHPAIEAFKADWSRVRVHKIKDQKLTITEVPTTLTKSYLYTVLIEQLGETISRTAQEPHTRVLVYDYKGKQDTTFVLLATLLPDEGWSGDVEALGTDPFGSDFSGTSVYTAEDGTPLWGYRYDNGESLYEFYFNETDCAEEVADIKIEMGVGQPYAQTRAIWTEVAKGFWYIDTNNDGYPEWVVMNDPIVVVARRVIDGPVSGGSGLGNLVPVVGPINLRGGSTSPPNGGSDPGNNQPTDIDADFTVTVMANPAAGGSVSGGGTFSSPRSSYSQPIQYPTASISASPSSGYLFGGWAGSAETTANPYTFTVNAHMLFVANFRPCYTSGKANPLPAMKLAPPVASNIAGATYGMTRKNEYGRPKMHNGIDLAGPVGTPVFAQFDGTISSSPKPVNGQPDKVVINGKTGYPSGYVGDEDGGGNRIYIDSSVGGKTVKSGYMHLMAGNPFGINPATDQPWKPGDKIKAGEVIGYIGITGNANEKVPHLHLRTLVNGAEVNPKTYLNAAISTTQTTITTPCN